MPNDQAQQHSEQVVLLTGATGYIGGRLIEPLQQSGEKLRCIARKPEKLRSMIPGNVEVVATDVLDTASLKNAL